MVVEILGWILDLLNEFLDASSKIKDCAISFQRCREDNEDKIILYTTVEIMLEDGRVFARKFTVSEELILDGKFPTNFFKMMIDEARKQFKEKI